MELVFLLCLFFKHAFVDLPLQVHLGPLSKIKYLGNGHKHYAEHGFFTFIVALFFFDPLTAVKIGMVDYILHWHIDFAKQHVCNLMKYKRHSTGWWWITAVDQCLHFATYFLIFYIFTN